MLRLPLLFVLCLFAQIGFAQVRATTESGKKVMLFDNGTWNYEDKTMTETATKVTVPDVATPLLAVDSTREIKSEFEELFYMPSPRLVRYFGEVKGQIRCKLACSNKLGKVQVHFMWEIPLGDGPSYFGNFDEGTKITFHMRDGQTVELQLADETNIKAMEKYNYTVISGATLPLDSVQIAALSEQPFRKIEVDWKKKPEAYEVQLSSYFMDTLPTVY
jgi:transcriptional antiterminator Rof (Rho-off)